MLRSVGFNPAEAEISKLLTDFEMEGESNISQIDYVI